MKKNLIKKLGLAALLALPLGAQAQTEEKLTDVAYLVVEQETTTVRFALTSEPVISFDNGNLIVASQSDTLSTALSGVKNYRIESQKVSTGIREVPAASAAGTDGSAISFANAEVQGLKAGARVAIYTTDGKQVAAVVAGTDGKAALSLSQLPKGIYILRTPGKSFKIVNR